MRLPLVIVEALAIAHQYANELGGYYLRNSGNDGQPQSIRRFSCHLHTICQTRRYEAQGLLEKWMEHADVLVIDDFPVYMPRRGIKEIAINIGTCEIILLIQMVISLEQNEFAAYSLRRHLHKTIIQRMSEFPESKPLLKAENLPLLHG